MHTTLSTVWHVGKVAWRKDDTAYLTIARTKTSARIYAERQLALASRDWAKSEGFVRRMWQQYSRKHYSDFDQYAEAVVAGRYNCSDSHLLRQYLCLRDGIWLYGPNGEQEHITEPSKNAIQAVVRNDRERDAMMASIIKNISKIKVK